MAILNNDPLTQLSFSVYENKGVFSVLLGSGVSRAADIPTGWEITVDLIRRVALAQGLEDQADWAAWYRAEMKEEPNYSKLLEQLASSPAERRSILHSYIEPTTQDQEEGKKIPTAAHRAIAALVRDGYMRLIITTNFDRLMENALRELGVEPTVVASIDALSGAEPISHTTCYILKLHGDYKDARILNTDEELNGYPAEYDELLDRILDEYGLIVAGWSGEWDLALRAAFLRAPNRRYPIYWARRGTVSDGAQEIIDQRRARVIEVADANSFFSDVLQRVETLEQTHRQHPLSIDLLVNTTKRYLGKLGYRIQLDELFSEAAERLIANASDPELAPQGSWSDQEFRSRIGRYEAATEPLARMAGVLGRWGDDSELSMMLDLIRSIFAKTTASAGGFTPWLNLRGYPAVLLFSGYGLGLIRAGRWGALHAFLSAQLAIKYDAPLKIVDGLFLDAWEGCDREVWQRLEGFERRKTPLSDHLCSLFADWGESFLGVLPDFELLFERFELLCSIASMESMDEDLLTSVRENDQPSWIPVGRVGWRRSDRKHLLLEIESAELKDPLLKAGFANGSEGFLNLSLYNFNLIANRMGW